MTQSSTAARAFALVLIACSLSGCAGSNSSQGFEIPQWVNRDLSLAESKSPAQLLRNSAVARIPKDVVLSISADTDSSEPCLRAEDDPEGIVRRWHSSVDVNLTLPQAPNTAAIVQALIATFTAEGWTSQSVAGSQAIQGFQLTDGAASAKSVSLSELRFEGVVAGDKASSFVRIGGLGPCVVTDGTNSAEVTDLGKL
jgi:hypothetical protein